ncbi:hypothetical protein EV182_006157, partial [Spiromyces aspiralis]
RAVRVLLVAAGLLLCAVEDLRWRRQLCQVRGANEDGAQGAKQTRRRTRSRQRPPLGRRQAGKGLRPVPDEPEAPKVPAPRRPLPVPVPGSVADRLRVPPRCDAGQARGAAVHRRGQPEHGPSLRAVAQPGPVYPGHPRADRKAAPSQWGVRSPRAPGQPTREALGRVEAARVSRERARTDPGRRRRGPQRDGVVQHPTGPPGCHGHPHGLGVVCRTVGAGPRGRQSAAGAT